MGGNNTARFQMSETLKALLRALLLLVSACLPYYFRLVRGMKVDLADFLYSPAILAVVWWPTGGTVFALSLSLFLLLSHLFAEPVAPLLYDLQRGLTLFAIAFARAPAAELAPFTYSEIVAAIVIGLVFFGTLPSLISWIGIGVITCSGVLVARSQTMR